MSVLATKPAPLALGTRDADGGSNRVELLPRKNTLVTQLLDDFVSYGSPAKPAARPATPPAAPTSQPGQPSEIAQLRTRVVQLETRLRALEAKAAQPAQDMNERVVAVLEQLIAELRERA